MKKVFCLLLGALLLLCACSNSSANKAEQAFAPASLSAASPAEQTTPKALSVTVAAATPSPLTESRSLEGPRLAEEGEEIPAAYTPAGEAKGGSLYVYLDEQGALQYRLLYGAELYENGVLKQKQRCFRIVDGEGNLLSEAPADTALETYAAPKAAALPTGYHLREGYTSSGSVIAYTDAEGKAAYALYAAVGKLPPAFYPSDETGTPLQGKTALTEAILFPDYTPSLAPKVEGELLLVVYLGSQAVCAFSAEQGEWVEKRIMICSTGASGAATPTGCYAISDQYPYKLLGSSETHLCYGQYASRITGHYLFHSVPISNKSGDSQQLGRTMMETAKYNKLGRRASNGCVRLTVVDAKWIYDNAAKGTRVLITSDKGPVPTSPPTLRSGEPYASGGLGWDPTDPDLSNPYLNTGN